jgi:hypothetical protein
MDTEEMTPTMWLGVECESASLSERSWTKAENRLVELASSNCIIPRLDVARYNF